MVYFSLFYFSDVFVFVFLGLFKGKVNLSGYLEVGCESLRGLLHPTRGGRAGIWETVPCLGGKKGTVTSQWTLEIARVASPCHLQTMTAI